MIHWWNALYLVARAFFTNNRGGMREDAFGRSYKVIVRRFGYFAMVKKYCHSNSWHVPPTNWFWLVLVLLILHIVRSF